MALVNLRTGMWFGDNDLPLNFPDNWNVSVYPSKDAKAMDEQEIEQVFLNPIGTKRIKEIASGKQSAAIIVSDLSRPTPAYQIIPYILRELKEGGIEDEGIRFVIGGGSHRPLTREEMSKIIGETVTAKYEVYNHDVYSETLSFLGNLEAGTPVYIHEVVHQSDVKITIGGIIPHGGAGFGGGAKMIVPGIAGHATIAHNHGQFKGRGKGNVERQGEEKDMRDNAVDVARHIGLDIVADIVLTSNRQIAGLYVGDVVEAHRQGARFAKEIYETIIPKKEIEATDIIVINCYPQDYDPVQLGKSMWPSGFFSEAQKVVINPASDGILYHGMGNGVDYQTFLEKKAEEQEKTPIPEKAEIQSKDDFVLLSSNFPKDEFYKRYPTGALFYRWDDLMEQLKTLYDAANVAVIPYSPIQLPNVL